MDVAALLICIRLNPTTNTSEGVRIIQTPGSTATVNISIQNEQLFAQGVDYNMIIEHFAWTIPNPAFFDSTQNRLIPIFYSDPHLMFTQSVSSNIRTFSGDEILQITPDVVSVAEVQQSHETSKENSTQKPPNYSHTL